MVKPNFSFEKRQKELAKKKSEEKRQRKLENIIVPPVENQQGQTASGPDDNGRQNEEGQ